MSNAEAGLVASWYWASFHELKLRARQALADIEEGSLDFALARDLVGSSVSPLVASNQGLSKLPEHLARDRKQLAAFGAVSYAGGRRPNSEKAKAFQSALERLLRQRDEGVDSWATSPRLALGISMGARHFRTHEPLSSLAEEVMERLSREVRDDNLDLRDMLLLAHAIQLLATDDAAACGELDIVMRRILARTDEGFSSREVVAVIWASYRLGGYCQASLRTDLMEKAERLTGKLPMLQVNAFEPVDWAMLWVALDKLDARLSARGVSDPVKHIEAAVDGFTDMINALRHRRTGKPGFVVEDEYDVQDILYVALRPSFPDLEREDLTGKDMGSNKRVDLVSSQQKVIIEVKMVRDRRHARDVFDEIKIDVQSYHTHPACESLVVFIYDPKKLIQSARAKEAEFSGPREVRPGKLVNVQLRIRP